MTDWLDQRIVEFSRLFPDGTFLSYSFNLRGLLAVLLVCLVCGAVGSLVVGNRMAFFSDALAHCAFAGVALGLLLGIVSGAEDQADVEVWVTLMMVGFGLVIGLAITLVREYSGQTSDTVIGVFFAASLGLGAVFLKAASTRRFYPPEDFLFGAPTTVSNFDLLTLLTLAPVTLIVLAWLYNEYVLSSFNRSLALSRRARVRLFNYVFVILLALVVNLSIKVVGAVLINALLVVPAAAAANLGRNMRQLFWLAMSLCLFAGVAGYLLSWELRIPVPGEQEWPRAGPSGTIVLVSVTLFFLTMFVPALRRGFSRRRRLANSAAASENDLRGTAG